MTREEEIQVESHCALNKESIPDNNNIAFEKGFCIGAKWADKYSRKGLWGSEKVIRFIKDNVREYHKSGVFHVDGFINDLCKAMEN